MRSLASNPERKNMITIKNIIYSAFALLALACFALSPSAQAVCQNGCSDSNAFLGEDALVNNSTGALNTAVGFRALLSNTDGSTNTATGANALISNTTGNDNTATGLDALASNTTGNFNTAAGEAALGGNLTGQNNTAIGYSALSSSRSGRANTAIGDDALANASGSSNIALGAGAGVRLTAGSNNIYIGNLGTFSEERTIRIGDSSTHGRTSIAGISGVAVASGVGVMIDTNGQLGTVVSSKRFKDNIKPMDKASEAILAMKPVTFRYKHEFDPAGIPQFGLVAEDVQKINPDLVARDNEGKAYTVRYEAVNAMALNEFLKEHRHVKEQDATIARQQKQIDALTAGLQKVSAQLEASRSAPQLADSNY
jgi:hypothetical protein